MAGAAGSNECPAGSARIEAEAACRTAADAAGKTPRPFGFVVTNARWPRGCYYSTLSNAARLNTHAVGAGYSYYRLLCAVATGAPRACPVSRCCCALRAACCVLQVACCLLHRVCLARVACCRLHLLCFALVACCRLHAGCCIVLVLHALPVVVVCCKLHAVR